MRPNTPDPFDPTFPVIGILAVVAFVLAVLLIARLAKWFGSARGRRDWRRPSSAQWRQWQLRALPRAAGRPISPDRPFTNSPDAADQLRIVMRATFAPQTLLNKSEARLFTELDSAVSARNPTWRVMAQVSLGEILVAHDPEAYRCINAKRVDLLLVDAECRPRHAVEYQGGAHHQGTAAARDAVKKEALRRAGIGYHEVIAGFTTPSELRRLVERIVDEPVTPNRI